MVVFAVVELSVLADTVGFAVEGVSATTDFGVDDEGEEVAGWLVADVCAELCVVDLPADPVDCAAPCVADWFVFADADESPVDLVAALFDSAAPVSACVCTPGDSVNGPVIERTTKNIV